jgi:N-carbamoyl-L-amino-acid hydrolase
LANDLPHSEATLPSPAFLNVELRELAEKLFDQFREMSFDGEGISRETYGPGETAAMEVIERLANEYGFVTEWDAARNLIIRLEGREPDLPVVATGSHLDSVPQGGNFDGAAGVIAGLMTLITANSNGPPRRTMELLVLRGEESAWYGGPCYFGSRAMFGLLTQSDLESTHRVSGNALAHHMAECGVDLTPIKAGQKLIDPDRFYCWIELHIEQGPVLIAREKPVGLVTGIRGNVRHRRVVCRGEAAHSGAVPRWLRHDAVLAMSELLMRIDEHWRILLEWGEDLVVTSGIVGTNPDEHAVSRVPGEVSFALEYRSQDTKTLTSFGSLINSECKQIGEKRGVEFDLGEAVYTEPARMSEGLVALLVDQADEAGIPCEVMPSGAGHDSAIFANSGIPSAMVFVRNDKGSHNPHEAMELPDFFAGAEVLSRTLYRAANSSEEMEK